MSTRKVAEDLQRIAQLDPDTRKELASLVRQAGLLKPSIDVYYEPKKGDGIFTALIKVPLIGYRSSQHFGNRLKEAEADIDSAVESLLSDMEKEVTKKLSKPHRVWKRLSYHSLEGFEKDWIILKAKYGFGGFFSKSKVEDRILHQILSDVSHKHKARYLI